MQPMPMQVNVAQITGGITASPASPAVRRLAEQVLKCGTLAMPIVVRQTGIQSFELLAGARGLAAARICRAHDPRRFEQVLAFIVETAEDAVPFMNQYMYI